MIQDDTLLPRGSSVVAQALRRTVAASALGIFAAAGPAAAYAPDQVTKDDSTKTMLKTLTSTIREKPEIDTAFDLKLTPIQLAGCSIGHTSHSQFTCN